MSPDAPPAPPRRASQHIRPSMYLHTSSAMRSCGKERTPANSQGVPSLRSAGARYRGSRLKPMARCTDTKIAQRDGGAEVDGLVQRSLSSPVALRQGAAGQTRIICCALVYRRCVAVFPPDFTMCILIGLTRRHSTLCRRPPFHSIGNTLTSIYRRVKLFDWGSTAVIRQFRFLAHLVTARGYYS